MKLKKLLIRILPKFLSNRIRNYREIRAWGKQGYLDNAPQFVKQNIFLKYSLPNTQWIETGTYLGTTTEFLVDNFTKVYTIEPETTLYQRAIKKFTGKNVELFNDVSESVFPTLLPKISGNCNFWLDGHYSAGITFQGEQNCPLEDELSAIELNLSNFDKIAILIDDVRHIYDDAKYPSIDFIIDWARKNKFNWRIEQDILIMRNFT
ncbi:hypothetical protein ACFLR6_00250 [Campylobacterota bacterium]